jgi:beta-lactamase regulating signal transducer with metallopeptidase domain
MTSLTHALGLVLLHSLWQGAVVAMALWISLRILRRRSAQARYLASCTTMFLLVLLPALTLARVYPQHAFFIYTTTLSPVDWRTTFEAWAPLVWAAGVAVFSARLLWACWRVSLLKRQGVAVDDRVLSVVSRLSKQLRIVQPVRVINSFLADGPSVAGWIRPVILLPAATILALTPEQLEAVLAHELAHIRRYDYLVNLVQMLIETLWFYHPAAWWISGRIRRERELCCDDIAVNLCGNALCYARALAALERMRTEQTLTPAMALGARDGGLLFRIQRLLGVAPRERQFSRVPAFAALLLSVMCFALSLNQAHAQAAAPLPAQSAPAPQQGQTPPTPPQAENKFGILLPPVPVSAESWIRFSTPDTSPLASRSASYRFGWELGYLSSLNGWGPLDLPWLNNAPKTPPITPEAKAAFERTVAQMTAARDAAQSDQANGIPTWLLTIVDVTGLSDARRDDLLSRLPVHESYPVSHDRMDTAGQAIWAFDARLRFNFVTSSDGHAEMHIIAPTEN